MVRSRKNRIFGMIGFVLTAVVITWLYPREARFKYEYQQGANWMHEDLYAPYDFPIRKPAREVEDEKREIAQHSRSYFIRDTIVDQQVQTQLLQVLDSVHLLAVMPDQEQVQDYNSFRKTLKTFLDSLYRRGIIDRTKLPVTLQPDAVILLDEGKQVYREKFMADILVTEKAVKKIVDFLITGDSVTQQMIPLVTGLIKPNITYDKQTTERFREEAVKNISLYKGALAKGELVIARGEYIDEQKFNILESLRNTYRSELEGMLRYYSVLGGQALFVCTWLTFLFFFLNIFRQKLFRNFRQTTSVLVLLVMVVALASLTDMSDDLQLYMVPFVILPILLRSFYDTRLALFVHIISVMLNAYFAPNGYEFVILEMGAGITSIFSFVNIRKRQQLFNTVLLTFLVYCLLYMALTLIREGNLSELQYEYFVWVGISCLLALFCFPLIYIFEKIFGLFSDVTLLELSDTNSKLLRELSARAPGTFQHSVQVANLAEAAIEQIGGNSLLIRAGALYHDIGKMEEPQYFIENQVGGYNPHDELSFEESAIKIISHVSKGVEIARKNRIPSVIIDFIRTHHGTQTVQYFYRNYVKSFPDADTEMDKKKFSYPGPIPFSKETAVLMMADAVEAASRSIQEPDSQKLDQLVDKIIDYQIAGNQFINSDITLRDIRDIRRTFKEKLMNIYHVRIEYPE